MFNLRLALSFLAFVTVLPAASTAVFGQTTTMQETYIIKGKPATKIQADAAILVNDTIALIRNNQLAPAEQKLVAALKLDPTSADAHHNLGLVYSKQGRSDEAIAEFKQALSRDPTLEPSYLSLGGTLQSQGKLTEAVQTYSDYMKKFPTSKDGVQIRNLIKALGAQIARDQQITAQGGGASAPDYFAESVSNPSCRWPASRMPLKVFIAEGTATTFFKPEYKGIVKQSFEQWQAVSNKLVTFQFVDAAAGADITCGWVGDAKQLANTAEAGETKLTSDSNGIRSASLRFLTSDVFMKTSVSDNRLQSICLHEIGHALGLVGHTSNPLDVMFLATLAKDEARTLTQRDANTLIKLYSQPQ